MKRFLALIKGVYHDVSFLSFWLSGHKGEPISRKEDVSNHDQACVRAGVCFFLQWGHRKSPKAAAIGETVCLTSLYNTLSL